MWMYGEKRIGLYFHEIAEYEGKGPASTPSVKTRIYKLCSLYISCQAGKHQQRKNEGRRERKPKKVKNYVKQYEKNNRG